MRDFYISGVCSSSRKNLNGAILDTAGATWVTPMPLGFEHRSPDLAKIGVVESIVRAGDVLRFRARVDDPEIIRRIATGELSCISVGAKKGKSETLDDGTEFFRAWEIFELSVCEHGGNEDALIETAGLGAPDVVVKIDPAIPAAPRSKSPLDLVRGRLAEIDRFREKFEAERRQSGEYDMTRTRALERTLAALGTERETLIECEKRLESGLSVEKTLPAARLKQPHPGTPATDWRVKNVARPDIPATFGGLDEETRRRLLDGMIASCVDERRKTARNANMKPNQFIPAFWIMDAFGTIDGALQYLMFRCSDLDARLQSAAAERDRLMRYGGIWRVDQSPHGAGTVVTCAGSLWIAEQETSQRPGTDGSWRLIAKRGSAPE